MSDTQQKCPVCMRDNIDAQATACPQCNADLACFKVLDSLVDAQTIKADLTDSFVHSEKKLDEILAGVTNNARAIEHTQRIDKHQANLTPPASNNGHEQNFRLMVILGFVAILIIGTFTAFIMFDRIKTLEERLRLFSQNSQTENRRLNDELARIKGKYSVIGKNIELQLLKKELEYNKLLNQKFAMLVERIAVITKEQQRLNEQNNVKLFQLHELFNNRKVENGKNNITIQPQLNNEYERLKVLATAMNTTIKELKQQHAVENKKVREEIKQQQEQLEKIVQSLEQQLQRKSNERKAFVSFFKIRFF